MRPLQRWPLRCHARIPSDQVNRCQYLALKDDTQAVVPFPSSTLQP